MKLIRTFLSKMPGLSTTTAATSSGSCIGHLAADEIADKPFSDQYARVHAKGEEEQADGLFENMLEDVPESWKRLPADERIALLRDLLVDAIYQSAPEGVGYFNITISERKGQEWIVAAGFTDECCLFHYRPQKFAGWLELTPYIEQRRAVQ